MRITRRTFAEGRDLLRGYGVKGVLRRARHEIDKRMGRYAGVDLAEFQSPISLAWPVLKISAAQDFYANTPMVREAVVRDADQILQGQLPSFGDCVAAQSFPPAWHRHPKTRRQWPRQTHWTQVSTSDVALGDIKWIWQPSRFQFSWALGRAYVLTQDERYAQGFYDCVLDW